MPKRTKARVVKPEAGMIGRVVCLTHMQVELTCAKRPDGCKLELRPRVVTAARVVAPGPEAEEIIDKLRVLRTDHRRLQALLDNSIQQEAFNLLGQ